MRRILLTLAVLLAWTCYASAGEIVAKIPVEEYQAIKNKLEAMEKKISDLEKQIKSGEDDGQSRAVESVPVGTPIMAGGRAVFPV